VPVGRVLLSGCGVAFLRKSRREDLRLIRERSFFMRPPLVSVGTIYQVGGVPTLRIYGLFSGAPRPDPSDPDLGSGAEVCFEGIADPASFALFFSSRLVAGGRSPSR